MGKYNSNILSSKFVQNYIKNQLWKKNNSEYVPFLSVRSVPTKGKANRVMGWKTGRQHHFLSKLEYNSFFYFDWSEDVIDIKEQYPLFPIEVLQNISEEAGIEYPSFNGEPIIMTTDFFITAMKNNNIVHYARTIKPSSDLANERIIEKFEIERRYFKSKNIDWGIITEKELPHTFSCNMEILHSNTMIDSKTYLEKQYKFTVYKQLIEELERATSKEIPIFYALTGLSNNLNINLPEIVKIFFSAIIDKIIILDIYRKPLNINTLTVDDVTINTKMLMKEENTI